MNIMEGNLTEFKYLFATYILPLLPGSTLSGPFASGTLKDGVCYDTEHRLRVAAPPCQEQFFVFERTIPFSEEERSFMEEIMRLACPKEGNEEKNAAILLVEAITSAVARQVAPEFPDAVLRVIHTYEERASQSGSKSRTIHTTGMRLMRHKKAQSNFFTMDKQLLEAFGSNPDTLLSVDAEGGIQRVEKIVSVSSLYTGRQEILAPIGCADIAAWSSSRHKVVIRLMEDGTLLLFSRKRLMFARRGTQWRAFPHSLADIATLPERIEGIEPETVKAVYLSALDLAGGGPTSRIIILRRQPGKRSGEKNGKKPIHPLMASTASAKNARILSRLVNGRRFSEVPRAIRREICAMGGTLLMDGKGNILRFDLCGGIGQPLPEASQPGVFPGSGLMELFNREGPLNLQLSVY